MPTINTQDLIGLALDWAVAHAEALPLVLDPMGFSRDAPGSLQAGWWAWPQRGNATVIGRDFAPSTNPAQGHPLLERERISLQHLGDRIGWGARWPAWVPDGDSETIPAASGPTMLIAGLRCLVAARLGPTVDVPQELLP